MEAHIVFQGNNTPFLTYNANSLDDKGSPDLMFWMQIFESLIVLGIVFWLIGLIPPLRLPRRQVVRVRRNGQVRYAMAREGFTLIILILIGITDFKLLFFFFSFCFKNIFF